MLPRCDLSRRNCIVVSAMVRRSLFLDAGGFVASGVMGAKGRKHRNVAFGSIGVSALSAAVSRLTVAASTPPK